MKLIAAAIMAISFAGAVSACPFSSEKSTSADTTILPPKTTGS